MPGESSPPRMVAEVLAWQVVLYWWNRHRAPAPPIHRTLHCYGRRRATRRQFAGKCSGYSTAAELDHWPAFLNWKSEKRTLHVCSSSMLKLRIYKICILVHRSDFKI